MGAQRAGRQIGELLLETVREWSADQSPRLAAGLAYYAVFSIAPLLVIAVAVAGLFFGREAAQGEIVGQIEGLIGREGAVFVQELVEGAANRSSGVVATIVGLVALFVAVTGVFEQLLFALNTVWDVPPTKAEGGLWRAVRRRFLSFTMVLAVSFLLLVSLLVSAGLSAAGRVWAGWFAGGEVFWQGVNLAISLVVITVMFAFMFKYLPETDVRWRDVWLGAAVTAGLFTLGKTLIGLYLGKSAVGSSFGAAGSLVLILLWVNYSAQILFLGAEFTEVYARHFGSRAGKQKAPGAALEQSATERAEATAHGAPGRGPFGQPEPEPAARPFGARAATAAPNTTGGTAPGAWALAAGLLVAALVGLRRLARG